MIKFHSQFDVVTFKEAPPSLLVSDEEKEVLFLDLLEETWNFPAGLHPFKLVDVEWNVGHQGQREMICCRLAGFHLDQRISAGKFADLENLHVRS